MSSTLSTTSFSIAVDPEADPADVVDALVNFALSLVETST